MRDPHHQRGAARLPRIIHRPDLQSRRQRSLFALLAGIGWLVWLYLFLPLVTLLGWHFGVVRFRDYVIDSQSHTWASLTIYVITIAGAGAALLIWAFYNYRRFRHADRRRPAAPMTAERLAITYGMNADEVARLQQARVATFEHDDHGNIIAVRPKDVSVS